MKLQVFELRLQQTRRKAPKVASLIALTSVLSVIIFCVYSPPSVWYIPRKISQAASSSGSLEESTRRPPNNDEFEAAKSPEMEPSGPPSSIKSDLTIAKTTSPSQGDNNDGRTQIPIQQTLQENEGPFPVPNPSGIDLDKTGSSNLVVDKESCDLFTGEWVPNPEAPYYTNATCYGILDHQNCMKYGRPDTDFLKWRWKPDGCELPIFDPHQFLELIRGKSIAVVGDSVARNHMMSLMCLLSRVKSIFTFLILTRYV